MYQKFFSPKALAAFAVILLSLVSVTYVSAHGGNTALIHSCVNNTSGEIKIIAATANCPSNYHSLDWNIQGPAGISGLEIVTVNSGTQVAARIDVFVECPAGKQVLGGGYGTIGSNLDTTISTSAPYGPYQWVVTAVTNDYPNVRSGWSVQAYAICANVAP